MARAINPSFDVCPEALWRIDSGRRGLGLAKEAVHAAAQWFDAHGFASRTVCMIDTANTPSRRIAELAGFHFLADALYQGHPVHLYERQSNSIWVRDLDGYVVAVAGAYGDLSQGPSGQCKF